MSSFSDYLENAALSHVFRAIALPSPAQVYLALYTAAPSDAGGGTEVAGNGYARQAVTFGAPAGGSIANTGAVSFTASGGAIGNVVAVGFFDAATAGNLLAWSTITAATVGDGDSINFPVGQLTISLT